MTWTQLQAITATKILTPEPKSVLMYLVQGVPDLTRAVKKFQHLTCAYLNVIREVGSEAINYRKRLTSLIVYSHYLAIKHTKGGPSQKQRYISKIRFYWFILHSKRHFQIFISKHNIKPFPQKNQLKMSFSPYNQTDHNMVASTIKKQSRIFCIA